ncbi:hypothetical protein RvY_02495 [Ramazzottius varieornatus]|uniref:Uncharacterized protein n=1 Tax=Ramazzottius varieornatus TaxID=947166 RepID=A0A1D1UJV9_RAMVA|nr:hypothetical protein RvY_02495 [Ramazzottius varieornatus]
MPIQERGLGKREAGVERLKTAAEGTDGSQGSTGKNTNAHWEDTMKEPRERRQEDDGESGLIRPEMLCIFCSWHSLSNYPKVHALDVEREVWNSDAPSISRA